MQKLLIAAALLAAGYFAYTEYMPGAGVLRTSSSSSGGFSAMTGASRSVTGAVAGAAARIAN